MLIGGIVMIVLGIFDRRGHYRVGDLGEQEAGRRDLDVRKVSPADHRVLGGRDGDDRRRHLPVDASRGTSRTPQPGSEDNGAAAWIMIILAAS